MMLIGLGKHEGAKIYHRAIIDYSFLEIITAVADVVLQEVQRRRAAWRSSKTPTTRRRLIDAVAAAGLLRAREGAAGPAPSSGCRGCRSSKVDLLIIDEIGKNISGSGMDTNVVGRKYNDHAATEQDDVAVQAHFRPRADTGNARQRAAASAWPSSRTSARSSRSTCGSRGSTRSPAGIPRRPCCRSRVRPIAKCSTRRCRPSASSIRRTRRSCTSPTRCRLGEVLVSEAYLGEIADRDDLEIVDGPFPMEFDAQGNLYPVNAAHAAVGAH